MVLLGQEWQSARIRRRIPQRPNEPLQPRSEQVSQLGNRNSGWPSFCILPCRSSCAAPPNKHTPVPFSFIFIVRSPVTSRVVLFWKTSAATAYLSLLTSPFQNLLAQSGWFQVRSRTRRCSLVMDSPSRRFVGLWPKDVQAPLRHQTSQCVPLCQGVERSLGLTWSSTFTGTISVPVKVRLTIPVLEETANQFPYYTARRGAWFDSRSSWVDSTCSHSFSDNPTACTRS